MEITCISFEVLKSIVSDLQRDGWQTIEKLWGVAGSVECSLIRLQKQGYILKFDYDNWTEGNIEGPDDLVRQLDEKYQLSE